MRDRLRTTVGRGIGWLLPLAILTIPGCSFDAATFVLNLDPGSPPRSSAVFCDIEDFGVARHCATPEEVLLGIPLSQAAVALTRLQSSNFGLDYSPEATAALGCAPGQPVTVTFKGRFPDGLPVCLNCGEVVGTVFADANAVCVARCKDLHGSYQNVPKPDVDGFCVERARASTNAGTCVEGACTDAGALRSDFVDVRRTPEPVAWVDLVNVAVSGPEANTLIKPAGAGMGFDAGAASSQVITRGDGYVEFTASETTTTRILGLSSGGSPDADPSQADINFGIRLSPGGLVRISENGTVVVPPDMNPSSSFAVYAAGDRLRVAVTDNLNGNASITYSLIPAACAPTVCTGIPLRTTGPAPYPFRVDASLATAGGTLTDVRLVRIR